MQSTSAGVPRIIAMGGAATSRPPAAAGVAVPATPPVWVAHSPWHTHGSPRLDLLLLLVELSLESRLHLTHLLGLLQRFELLRHGCHLLLMLFLDLLLPFTELLLEFHITELLLQVCHPYAAASPPPPGSIFPGAR